jgi:NAD(P)-dependent dehydrogenase (short-subunit alcohol dehydrogenase family)
MDGAMTDRSQLTASEVVARHDLTGKQTIVTGGYSGIGYETAKALAQAGARVVIAGRDPLMGPQAVAELKAATGISRRRVRAFRARCLMPATLRLPRSSPSSFR